MGTRYFHDDDFVFVSEEKAAALIQNTAYPGDLVFTQRGTIGGVAFIPPDAKYPKYILSQNQMKLTPDPSWVNVLFLCYYFLSPMAQELIQRNSIGSTIPGFNLTQLRDFPVPVPPLSEQETIASILGALDDKIELNRRMNETLEASAQAIFKSWFVDFDPIRAKASDEPADSICRRLGLTHDLLTLFPDSFQDSDLGEIPAGWQIVTVTALAEINAWTLSKSDKLDLIEYVEISEVSHGNIGALQVFKRGEEPSRARRRLRHGDTILSTVRPERGSYFLCLNPPQNLIASTGFSVITPTKVPWSFLHTALTQPEIFQYLGHQADGGAYPAIRSEIIGDIEFVAPGDTDLLNAFHSMCGPLYEQAKHNRQESRMLAVLREALLPKLLSGEVRVTMQGIA